MSNTNTHTKSPQPPTPLAKKLVRYILGFGVGVSVGLAPYLGLLNIPFFKPLLSLIPESIQDTVIPLSAAMMGTVAVVTEFYGGEHVTRAKLRRLFKRTLLIVIVTLVILMGIHIFSVVTVPILGGKESVSFIVGFRRPVKAPCTAEISDAECIKYLTLDISEVESFWGDGQVRLAKGLLILSYLSLTSSFGAIIGLIVLRDKIKSNMPPRPSSKAVIH
jgi:hypothetical protein